jgi:hypothetical protein
MSMIELLVELGLQLSSVDMKYIDLHRMEMPEIELLVKLGLQLSSVDMK